MAVQLGLASRQAACNLVAVPASCAPASSPRNAVPPQCCLRALPQWQPAEPVPGLRYRRPQKLHPHHDSSGCHRLWQRQHCCCVHRSLPCCCPHHCPRRWRLACEPPALLASLQFAVQLVGSPQVLPTPLQPLVSEHRLEQGRVAANSVLWRPNRLLLHHRRELLQRSSSLLPHAALAAADCLMDHCQVQRCHLQQQMEPPPPCGVQRSAAQ